MPRQHFCVKKKQVNLHAETEKVKPRAQETPEKTKTNAMLSARGDDPPDHVFAAGSLSGRKSENAAPGESGSDGSS